MTGHLLMVYLLPLESSQGFLRSTTTCAILNCISNLVTSFPSWKVNQAFGRLFRTFQSAKMKGHEAMKRAHARDMHER